MINLTITQAKKALKEKQFSAVELMQAHLNRIEKDDPNINAFITVTKEKALADAKKADELLSQGVDKPLLGIPYSLKDIFVTKGIKTTASSHVLRDFIPPYDATTVTKIQDAGGVLLGKTNLDAWAHGSSGENSDVKITKNPYNPDYTPGGSSSGPAASVAADFCLVATGTDTGGSIRLPASFCNVVGLKPTYGHVSRYGVIAMASSFDSIGHFTKTVEDAALFLQITAGHDEKDATTPDVPVPDYVTEMKKDIKGLRIGLPKEYFSDGLDPQIHNVIRTSVKILEKQGAVVKEISLPNTNHAIATYYIIQPAEVSSNLARFDGIRYGNDRNTFGDEARRRIMLGTFTLSAGYYDAYYKKATQVRTIIKQEFDDAWKDVDVIITPTSPTLPWKLGEKADPLSMYLSDVYTVTVNVAGIPGLSVPAGFIDGLPVGMQILAPQFAESTLFQVGYHFEKETEYWKRKPE